MDYKEKYEQTLQRAKDAREETESAATAHIIEGIFPELLENENKKIKEYLIRYIDNTMGDSTLKSTLLAWLEKQGESYTKRDVDDAHVEGMAFAKNELEKQGEQKPAWSEEDEKMLNSIIDDFYDGKTSNMLQESWLKSIKQRMGG